MLIKIALAAVLALGAASVAQAGSRDDNGSNTRGGYHVGPMGQWFGGPAFRTRHWGYSGYAYERYGYDYVPGYHRYWRYER
jgi:hypothetical protein